MVERILFTSERTVKDYRPFIGLFLLIFGLMIGFSCELIAGEGAWIWGACIGVGATIISLIMIIVSASLTTEDWEKWQYGIFGILFSSGVVFGELFIFFSIVTLGLVIFNVMIGLRLIYLMLRDGVFYLPLPF